MTHLTINGFFLTLHITTNEEGVFFFISSHYDGELQFARDVLAA